MGTVIPSYLWTQSHADCINPWKPCDAEYTWQLGSPAIFRYECGKEYLVSYVNSSRYESETPVQAAERKVQAARDALSQAKEDLDKANRAVRFGVQPSGGSIIKFERKYDRYDRKSYTYAALRVGSLWYLTCNSAYAPSSPMSWEELKTFIGDGKAWVPRYFDEVPAA